MTISDGHLDRAAESAFPNSYAYREDGSEIQIINHGMTLRDYFAAKALVGLLAQSNGTAMTSTPVVGASFAYEMADAMLKAREREGARMKPSEILTREEPDYSDIPAKSTPGPWNAVPEADDQEIYIETNDQTIIAVVQGYVDHPNNRGNARLIAAAPELYEALRLMLNAYSELQITTEEQEARDAAFAALAKAESTNE